MLSLRPRSILPSLKVQMEEGRKDVNGVELGPISYHIQQGGSGAAGQWGSGLGGQWGSGAVWQRGRGQRGSRAAVKCHFNRDLEIT